MAQVWKIAPGEHASHWELCRKRGCIILGWRDLKDYRTFKTEKAILKALGGGPGAGAGAASSIWRFANEIKPFDIVVANKGRSSITGIGIIKSEYLAPTSSKNPSDSESLPHARLVDWIIEYPIDLKAYFFGMPTVHSLNAKKVSQIQKAYLKKYPKLKETLAELFAGVSTEEVDDSTTEELLAAAQQEFANENDFDPSGIRDARNRIVSSIVRRQGQPAFRKRLIAAYNGKCAVTGCALEAVLEAAHIVPYKGAKTNHPGNGILLRADIHTLFDLRLVAVDEASMRLLVSPVLNGTEYEGFHGKKIKVPKESKSRPSRRALEQHRFESGLG